MKINLSTTIFTEQECGIQIKGILWWGSKIRTPDLEWLKPNMSIFPHKYDNNIHKGI